MNRVFKVIWSKTKNSYVVVSEFAKRSGKCSSSNCKVIVASVFAGMILGISSPALADDSALYTTISEPNVTGLGHTVGTEIRFEQRNAAGKRAVLIKDSSIPGGSMLLYETSSMSKEFVGSFTDSSGNKKTYTAKYENDDWTKSVTDASGTTTGTFNVQEFHDMQLNIGQVKKVESGTPKEQGYFLVHKKKITGQITGKEVYPDGVEESVERVGDIVTATVGAVNPDTMSGFCFCSESLLF